MHSGSISNRVLDDRGGEDSALTQWVNQSANIIAGSGGFDRSSDAGLLANSQSMNVGGNRGQESLQTSPGRRKRKTRTDKQGGVRDRSKSKSATPHGATSVFGASQATSGLSS